jgi:hypothetical protein
VGIKFQAPTTEDTSTQLQAQRNRERDEDLKALDAIVGPEVKKWAEAGKPVPFITDNDANMVPNPFAVTMRLAVPKNEVATFKQDMVRRSCLLYGTDPVYFANMPDAEGFTAVKWTFEDHKTESQKKKEKAEADKAEKAEGGGQDPTATGGESGTDTTTTEPEGTTEADWTAEGGEGDAIPGDQEPAAKKRGVLRR